MDSTGGNASPATDSGSNFLASIVGDGGSATEAADRNSEMDYSDDDPIPDVSTVSERPKVMSLRKLGIMFNTRRQAATRPMRGAATALVDQDDSGTYDPKAKPRRATTARRAKKIRLESGVTENSQHREKRNTTIGYGLVMTFSFTSDAGLEYLRSITPDPAPCPNSDLAFNNDNDGESESSGPDDESLISLNPRPGRRTTRRSRRVVVGPSRKDGLTVDQLTLGHPQRRGCKACFDVGDDECSLIDDRHDYPCEACDDAGIDCQFIIPPELKHICERCKRHKITCSYRKDGGKGAEACEGCQEHGVPCCAAPLKKSSSSRRYTDILEEHGDATPKINPIQRVKAIQNPKASQGDNMVQARRYVACNQCRADRLRCNLRRNELGPCPRCRKKGEECSFIVAKSVQPFAPALTSKVKWVEDTKQRAKGDSPKALVLAKPPGIFNPGLRYAGRTPSFRNRRVYHTKKAERAAKKYEQQNEILAELSASPKLIGGSSGIRHIRIKTAFSHPIEFFYSPAPNGSEPCSWCDGIMFGLIGHGEKEVEVIPAHGIQGYEEVGDGEFIGHGQKGEAPSRMCTPCTMTRCATIRCQNHEMVLIKDQDPAVYVPELWNKALEALEERDFKTGQLVLTAKFCSICTEVAHYECAARDYENGYIRCSLRLCEGCNDILKGWSIGKNEREYNQEQKIYILDDVFRERPYVVEEDGARPTMRADASFLTTKGEIFTRVAQGMQQPFSSGDDLDIMAFMNGEVRIMSEDSSTDEDIAVDEDLKKLLERAGKGKGRLNEKIINRSGFSKPLKSPFIKPKSASASFVRTTPSSRGADQLRPRQYGDWMETRPISARKSWAHGGGSGSLTQAYNAFVASPQGKKERGTGGTGQGKNKVDAIVISDDEDGDGPIMRGY